MYGDATLGFDLLLAQGKLSRHGETHYDKVVDVSHTRGKTSSLIVGAYDRHLQRNICGICRSKGNRHIAAFAGTVSQPDGNRTTPSKNTRTEWLEAD